MYIALYGSIENNSEEQGIKLSEDGAGPVATSILGLNIVAALCFSGVFIVLKVNHSTSQIKYHSGIFMISFISFLTSSIILIALWCLTLLKDADYRDQHNPAAADEFNAR